MGGVILLWGKKKLEGNPFGLFSPIMLVVLPKGIHSRNQYKETDIWGEASQGRGLLI